MASESSAGESTSSHWEAALDEFWATADLDDGPVALARMQQLVRDLGVDNAIAHFEIASLCDSIGVEQQAAAEYEAAMTAGLEGARLAQAQIQYGSTLRNLGRVDEAIAVLEATGPHPSIGNARAVFLALALHDAGRHGEALSLTIDSLISDLPRYRKSAEYYSRSLRESANDDNGPSI